MLKLISLLLLQLLLVGAQQAGNSTYEKTGDCQEEHTCVYNYEFSDEDAVSMLLNVEVTCHSVGMFNESVATQYCMAVNNFQLQGKVFKESDNYKRQQQESIMANMLGGLFCFVQTEDGKVVAAQHAATGENDYAINLKKSIAAAFQANFKGTGEEEEIDPQSDHISHYSYDEAPEGSQKMHRHVETNDVIEFSANANKKDIKLTKDEDIEYRNGKLYHSAGTTDVKLKEGKRHLTEGKEKSISEALKVHGSYSLQLDHCSARTARSTIRHRRSIENKINENMMEENLIANFDENSVAQKVMQEIRESLPSIKNALKELRDNPSNLKLYNSLVQLLQLENEYGTIGTYTAAIQTVLNYLNDGEVECSQPLDVEMCDIIYSLMSAEGSLRSQMVLLQALNTDSMHRIVHISTIRNPHMELIIGLEELLDDESFRTTSLLLEFGALASNGPPEVELEVVRYLLDLESRMSVTSEEFTTLLMAMGNTGSKYVVSTILNYTDSLLEDVQLSSIRACIKFTHLSQVLDKLNEVLESGPNEEVFTMILHTLVKGYHYAASMDFEMSLVADHPILVSLVVAATNLNDTELLTIVSAYLQEVGGVEALALMEATHYRTRRGTSDWDSNSNSDYNLVESLATRSSDVTTYPIHKAYIHATKIGYDEANVKAAGGVFLGYSDNLENIKGYGKLYAECNLLSWQRTLTDIEALVQKNGVQIHGKVYAEIGGTIYVNENHYVELTYNYEKNLYKSKYKLFGFTYSVFVYAGWVDLGVDVYLKTSVDLSVSLSALASLDELATATAAVIPELTISVVGSVSLDLVVVKIGASLGGNIGAQLEPTVSGKICAIPNYQTCVGLYFSKPASTIELYAWYRLREVEYCSGWGVTWPCGFYWGSENRVDSLSWSWPIGQSYRYAIYESCKPVSSSCSASPLG